jgi:hypothetical protein
MTGSGIVPMSWRSVAFDREHGVGTAKSACATEKKSCDTSKKSCDTSKKTLKAGERDISGMRIIVLSGD